MRVLVTGGGGFLGRAIIRQLLKAGHEVSTINRSQYPDLEATGVQCFQGDIADWKDVTQAVAGVDAVIHTAAKAGMWGPYDDYFKANVTGTQNIIRACQEFDVQRLVYTSSPSVVFGGDNQEGVDETAPYPKHYLAHYPRTKAMAERLVLNAKSPKLSVVSLRPHLIWGPGDNHLAPRLIQRQRQKRLRFIGKMSGKVDAVYVENAAYAHCLALERLEPDAPINGQSYFITNHEPWPTEKLINTILFSAGVEPVTKRVPRQLAIGAGLLLEYIYTFFKIKAEPPMTRFVAKQLSTSHWFDTKAAVEELGYEPPYSMNDGFARLREHYKSQGIKA
ncbi:NAD-dependent epimerase/dehydratase family protein [Pseudobacteriovorax antillogorgiicola]|uniref:Nucleoside-diphosphate-sugar epimerase n=1 Tax=Pseudobacteriovorax antillogorgiicola TaxID=1513793 RepID=A0A1Y6BWB0_9BACT|nr:NAD-dependent epimerase/dehydratase family protein [Pseudobacteriovorax antillogorgiicola]TCS52280.1 nucleoside-diphosphate-sugar epimerase [Pseudobacteriovorax antillogorgiicola]SMF30703.1 Nucleoside-diphosphate-sugar epimerase [Pseudobacteriovorax antillogorgiicola]